MTPTVLLRRSARIAVVPLRVGVIGLGVISTVTGSAAAGLESTLHRITGQPDLLIDRPEDVMQVVPEPAPAPAPAPEPEPEPEQLIEQPEDQPELITPPFSESDYHDDEHQEHHEHEPSY